MPWLSPSQQPALYNNPLEGRLGGYYPCRDITMSRPPYFHALATFFCKSNRLYRIYVRPDELVFIWAGKGGEGTAGADAVAKGPNAARGVLGAALRSLLDPSEANQARKEVLDRTPLDELIGDNPMNLRAPLDGFEEVVIRGRSDSHARAFSDHRHQAILQVRHQSLGKFRFGISTVGDVKVAMEELPRVFGLRGKIVRAEIGVPEREQPCGCVICRRNRG